MKRSLLCTTTAALLLAPLGHAQTPPPKYTKQDAKIESTQTQLTKPKVRLKEDKKRPDISAQDVFSGQGEQIKSVTESQIKVLQRLIDTTSDDDPDKPDFYFRMAELYAEQEHYYNFKARELDARIFDAQQNGKAGQAAQLKAQQADYEKKEKSWLTSAVKEYLLVTANPKFDKYKKMDQVLFYLAFLLTQQKREDLARPIFKRLIKDYPQSPFIPDAYFSFGEYFFENKDIENALKFYDRVLQFTDSRVYLYAYYKEGWCYINLQDYKRALEIFVDVIEKTKQQMGKKKDTNKLSLIKEARKDAVRSYSNIGTPEKAWAFFQRIGDEYAKTMLEQLAELYNSQGKFDFSISVYRQLIKLDPGSTKLCNWQHEILTNTLSRTGSRATPDSVNELQRMAAIYDKYKAMSGMKQSDVDECRENTAGSLEELATTWHKEAQKTGVKETYELATSLYKEYIGRFPKEKSIYRMTNYYAEILYKLEKYCDAAPVFTEVVKLDPSEQGKYRNEAAYAAVISWKNCLKVDESGHDVAAMRDQKGLIEDENNPKKPGKGGKGKKGEKETAVAKELKPIEIPEKSKKMIEAFDTYIKYVPNSKELPNIKYTKARIYYETNHFAEAAPFFKDIVDKHRDSELAIYSANLLFDCENALGEFDQLEVDAKTYCPIPQLAANQDFKHSCDAIQNGIARKKIERWEKDGLYRKAADEYVRLATEHPDDPRLAELYYNAAVDYEKAKAIGQAIQYRAQLIKLKPDDPLSKRAVFLLGRAYRNIAAFSNAADSFEAFATKYPGEKGETDASTALFTASFFRRGLGDTDKSIEDTNLFIKLYGGRKEYEDKAAGVFFGLGSIYEEQKNWTKLTTHLQEYLKTWGAKGGVDRQIVTNVKLGELKWKESCPVDGVNGACIKLERVRASSATRVAEKARKGKKRKKGTQLPAQCGPETKSKITIIARKPVPAKEAQTYFANALKEFGGGAAAKKVPGKDEAERNARIEAMMYHVAQARMMQGDQEYEKFLTMKIPDKLDFTPPDANASAKAQAAAKKRLEDAGKKFKGWLDAKGKQIELTRGIYQNVILFKQAHWAIAASARIGQLFQDFSGLLYTAPVPKAGNVPPGMGMTQDDFDQYFHDAYCDKMVDTAEPLETKAIEGLSTCLNKSTELSWYNEWSQLCEAELNQIKPAEYPLAAEIRAQAGYYDRRADAVPLITELK